MKIIEINATTRKETGKAVAKQLRRDKMIPIVMYGGEPQSLTVGMIEAVKLYNARHENFLIKLKIDGKDEKDALLKEIQLDPVKNTVNHLDFLELIAGKTLTTKIPLTLEGTPIGIKMGGIIEHFLWEISIECLPKDIPESYSYDITGLDIGNSLHISDLPVQEGVKILDKDEQVILTIGLPTGVAEEAEEEEVAEGEEGAEAAEGEEKDAKKDNEKEEKGKAEEATDDKKKK